MLWGKVVVVHREDYLATSQPGSPRVSIMSPCLLWLTSPSSYAQN